MAKTLISAKRVWVKTPAFGNRPWDRLEDAQVKHKGRAFAVATWRSHCVFCGANVLVTVPRRCVDPQSVAGFRRVACDAHKLTPSESASLVSPAGREKALQAIYRRRGC